TPLANISRLGTCRLLAQRHRRSLREQLRRLCRSRDQDIRLAVERCDQTVDAVLLQDGSELGAAGSNFTDRAVEIDIGDQPVVAVSPHHVVDFDRLPLRFYDLALFHDARWGGLLSSPLQLSCGA